MLLFYYKKLQKKIAIILSSEYNGYFLFNFIIFFILIGGILIDSPFALFRQLQLKVLDPQILDPIIYIPYLSY